MDPFTADPAVYMMPNVDVPADQWADPAFSLGKSAQIGCLTMEDDPPAATDLITSDRARLVQEKNRASQRRHRERQRHKLADAEAEATRLNAELAATRREVNRLGGRLLKAETTAIVAAAAGGGGGGGVGAALAVATSGGSTYAGPGADGAAAGTAMPPAQEAVARRAYATVAAKAAATLATTTTTATAPANLAASALDALFDANARLRAKLRGVPYATARRQVDEMHLSELLMDRRMLAVRVAALVGDPAHADPATPAGRELATLMELRHETVRAFFASTPKPMHMMFAAFERADAASTAAATDSDGRNSSGAAAAFAKWFHALRAMAPSPPQADALIAARADYLAAIRAAYVERMAIKKAMVGAEPSQDTWGARFTTQLTSQVALEALATCLEKEERAAAAFELVAQRVLSPAQFAVAYVTGDPSMPDWLAISNLLFHDPSRQAAATVAAVAAVTTVVAHATSGGPRASGCGPASASGTAAAPDSESGEVVVTRKGGGRAKRASGA